MRNIYSIDRLVKTNSHQIIWVDESLFTQHVGEQQSILGLINTATDQIRLELISNRDENAVNPLDISIFI